MLTSILPDITNLAAKSRDEQQILSDLKEVDQILGEMEPSVIDGSAPCLRAACWAGAIARKMVLALELGQFDLMFSMFLKSQEVSYRLENLADEKDDLSDIIDQWRTTSVSIRKNLMTKAECEFTEIYRRYFNMRDKSDATNETEAKKLEAQVVHVYRHQLFELKKYRTEAIKLHRTEAVLQANQSMITTVLQLRPYEKMDGEDQEILTNCQEIFINYIRDITPRTIDLLIGMKTGKSEIDQVRMEIFKNIMTLLSNTPPQTDDLDHVLFLTKCIDYVCDYPQSGLTVVMLNVILIHTQMIISAIENSHTQYLKRYPYFQDILKKLKSQILVMHRKCSEAYSQWYAGYSVSQNKDVHRESKEGTPAQMAGAKETEYYLNILLMRSYELSQKPNENIEEQEFINNAILKLLDNKEIPKTLPRLFGEKILHRSLQIRDDIKALRTQKLFTAEDVVAEVKDDSAATKITELDALIVGLRTQLNSKEAGYDSYQQWADAAVHRLYLTAEVGESKQLANALQEVEEAISYAEVRMTVPLRSEDESDSGKFSQKFMTLTLYIADVFEKQNMFLKSFKYYRKAISLNRTFADKLLSLTHKNQPHYLKLTMFEKVLNNYLACVYLQYVNIIEAKLKKLLAAKTMTKKYDILLNKYRKVIQMSKIIPAEMVNRKTLFAQYEKIVAEHDARLANRAKEAVEQQDIDYIQKAISEAGAEEKSNPDNGIEKYFSMHHAILEKSILKPCHRLIIQLYIFQLIPDQKDSKWRVAGLIVEILEKNGIFTQQDEMVSLNNYGLEDFKELMKKISTSATIYLSARPRAESEVSKIIAIYHARKAAAEAEITDKLISNLVSKFKPFVPADDKSAPGYLASDVVEQLIALARNSISELKCTWGEKKSLATKVYQWSLPKIELASSVPEELLRNEYFLKAKEIIDNANKDKQSKIAAEKERVAMAKRDKQLQKLYRKKHKNTQRPEAEDKEVKSEIVATLDHTKEQIEHLRKIKKAYDDFVKQKLSGTDAYFDCHVNEKDCSITLGLAMSTTHTAAFHAYQLRILKEDFLNKIVQHCFSEDIYSVNRVADQYAITIKINDLVKANQVGLDRRFLLAFKSLLEDTTVRHAQVAKESAVKKTILLEKEAMVSKTPVGKESDKKETPISPLSPVIARGVSSAVLGLFAPTNAVPDAQAVPVAADEKKSDTVIKDDSEQAILNGKLLGQRLVHNLVYRKFSSRSDSIQNVAPSYEFTYF